MARKQKTDNESPAQDPAGENRPETAETAAAPGEAAAEDAQEASAEAALQAELDAARTEAAHNWDLYLRERAELENVRKRTQRDKEEAIRFANDRLLKEMVPVLDNLERAVEHAGQNDDQQPALLEGVNMTITLFKKVLADFGVTPVAAVGEPFDPNLHQAMGQIETDEQPPNTVVTEFQKGYLLNQRLLRPSLVMVAKARPKAQDDKSGPQADD